MRIVKYFMFLMCAIFCLFASPHGGCLRLRVAIVMTLTIAFCGLDMAFPLIKIEDDRSKKPFWN